MKSSSSPSAKLLPEKIFFPRSGPAIIAAIVAVLITGAITRVLAQTAQTPAASPKTASQAFKNIQVLKDVPADQIIPSMQFISGSLGVECDFCHVEHEFDKDDKKEKKTAREMMKMMITINQENFEGHREVTCDTCHRGSPHPQTIPAILAEGPKPEAMEAMHDHDHDMGPPKTSPGEPVFAKYIQAVGGQAGLDKIASRVEKGNALMGNGHQAPIEIYTKAPDLRVSVMKIGGAESVTAFNGEEGWLTFPGSPVRMMSASDAEAAKLDAAVFYPGQLQKFFSELKLQEEPEKINGHDTSVVVGTIAGQPPVKFYFDKESGLLVRLVHYGDTPLGLNPTQVDLADYRGANGVKTPYKWTIARPNGAFTIQIDQVQSNVPIDAARFVKPAPAPTQGQNALPH